MVDTAIKEELEKEMDRLPVPMQQRVLDFAHALVLSEPKDPERKGVPGRELLRFAGLMSHEDAAEMLKAIEEECERIDPHGW